MHRGSDFFPAWPDCLGYACGLLLIWLVFLAFEPVMYFLGNPDAALGRSNETLPAPKTAPPQVAKQTSEEKLSLLPQSASSQELMSFFNRSSLPSIEISKWTTLDGINSQITEATKAIPGIIDKILPEEEPLSRDRSPSRIQFDDYRLPVDKEEKKKVPDQLEHFR